jgi:uncharacterized protein (TIGR02757 family)
MTFSSLHHQLEHLYHTFDVSMLSPDPLEVVRRFERPEDLEVAGLVAASLAYGRVENIIKALERIFALMDHQPFAFVTEFKPNLDAGRFDRFVYRFSRGRDIVCLIMMLQQALKTHGSLGRLFSSGFTEEDDHTGPALTRFVDRLLGFGCPFLYPDGVIPPRAGVRYFLPSPRRGSACKRLNLFVRWMVRNGGDGIDLGLWQDIPPARLIIPVDTHVARIARTMRLTSRRQADWKMAEEITASLRAFDPNDPVKYDFAICHWGMRQIRGWE